jgi:hypothetical protein
VGDVAPDFSLPLTDGNTFTLSQQRGKVVMLQFTASWCGVCRREMPHIEKEIWQRHKEDPAFVPALDTKTITVEMVIGRISAQGTEEFLQHTPAEMQAFWTRYQQMIDANHSDDILVSELA